MTHIGTPIKNVDTDPAYFKRVHLGWKKGDLFKVVSGCYAGRTVCLEADAISVEPTNRLVSISFPEPQIGGLDPDTAAHGTSVFYYRLAPLKDINGFTE